MATRSSRFSVSLGVAFGISLFALANAACSSDESEPTDDGSGTGDLTSTDPSTGAGTTVPAQPNAPSASSGGNAPPATATPPAATTKKQLLEKCAKDDECASTVCYVGEGDGYCSLKCTAATAKTVCKDPFDGSCNKKGFCRKP